MTKYYLRKRTLGSPGRIDLVEAEYNEILQARNNLLLALYIEENFDLVLANYLDFETTLLELATERSVRPSAKYGGFQSDRRLINRRLINLLTACRAYIYQTNHQISDIFSDKSDIVNNINNIFSSKYDKYSGYRIMEALRNHAQHRGWPIHGVTHDSQWVGEMSRIRFMFIPQLSTKALEDDKDFKKDTLQEIKDLGETIDVRPLVRQYVQGLIEVHLKIREILAPHVVLWEQKIRGTIKQFKEKYPEETTLGLTLFIEDEIANKHVDIFEEFMEYRRQLELENPAVTNLPASYTSNENDNIAKK
jgi:hypothetical protein